MKKRVSTTQKTIKWLFVLLLPFALIACDKQLSTPPTANPNPVHLSAEAQTKIVRVKNTMGVYTDNEADIIKHGRIIKNDWMTITYNSSSNDRITIEVESNPSTNRRAYYIWLTTGVESIYLHITQGGQRETSE